MFKQFKFPFTTAGVAQWQQWLAGLSPMQRDEEAARVEQGLPDFVPYRFRLDAGQVAFLDSLPSALCALWAAQLAYGIREEITITLVKPDQRMASEDEGGVKFIETESSTASGESDPLLAVNAGNGDFLRFTVRYGEVLCK